MSDIMSSFWGKLWVAKLGLRLMKKMGNKKGKGAKPAGFDVDMKDVMGMLGGFTVLRLTSMVGMKEKLVQSTKQKQTEKFLQKKKSTMLSLQTKQ